ncbi:hypothetical protein H6G76_19545 [Nostoc sp. FACHB-152]|uniref:hypothetical protein n=1 Tax=unclassified Nostoc TaxID=2593658 RepID=UPI00168354FC|nr:MULTISPECIES: hypothetical protein [unclassified Nostoc]MBD2449313.1 hypothetical protein [Nostoc sp. FACHB-152]MBD2470519.1 hypothetical protein [Nostoc sp. FACHB-145]
MLKSTVKSTAVFLTSLAVVVSVSQSANAQLNVGNRKIQRGLEREYLQYQLRQRNLNDMLVIPRCDIGMGTGCNKTGTVLQQLLTNNGGPSYYDLAIRAAGGKSNFNAFATYYGNNPRLIEIPYASFWKAQSPRFLDGYQYVLGQSVSKTPVLGLGTVTKNFAWSPISRSDNSLSPRQGLLDFKYSFGHELLREASKIPNLEQQIRDLNLPPEMTQFYLNNLSQGLNALQTGNTQALQQSILEIVSFPYSPNYTNTGSYGRTPIDIPTVFNALEGTPTVVTEVVNPDLALGIGEEFLIPSDTVAAFETNLIPGGSGFNFLPVLAGGGLVALLLLALGSDGDGGGSSNRQSPPVTDTPETTTPTPPITPTTPPNQCLPPGGGVIGVPPCDNPPQVVKPVDEPSTIKAILLLTLVVCILSRKQRVIQIKN